MCIRDSLCTFAVAFAALWRMRIPETPTQAEQSEGLLRQAGEAMRWLRKNRGILHLIFFLSAINLTASMYQAALPAMLLPRAGGETALGVVNTVTGVSMLLGSALASAWPKPRSRVRVICNTLLISMGTENLLLALGRSLPVWCVGACLGWIVIPLMNANLQVIMREGIPVDMQGRVWAARNTLQFFTIPVGYLLGGFLVDAVCEPLMAAQMPQSLLCTLFGTGKGSGAEALFLIMWIAGLVTCLVFRRDRAIWALEEKS